MTIKLGVIGLSEGNGHPYSWSAIFNGYDHRAMEFCGFPAIPEYLALQEFPRDSISDARVTHVWANEIVDATKIAQAAKIEHVVSDFRDMIGSVDAILLARDDAETHLEFASPFLSAGIPIYIDKPLALSVSAANTILDLEKFPGQVFSCSALRYALELQLTQSQRDKLGQIKVIDATVPKGWDKYAIHVIEPILQIVGEDFVVENVSRICVSGRVAFRAIGKNDLMISITAMGDLPAPISIRVYGENSWLDLTFINAFSAFKAALQEFVVGVETGTPKISHDSMLASIRMLEAGRLGHG